MLDGHPLLAKFERILLLTEAERLAILLLPVRLEEVKADQAIGTSSATSNPASPGSCGAARWWTPPCIASGL